MLEFVVPVAFNGAVWVGALYGWPSFLCSVKPFSDHEPRICKIRDMKNLKGLNNKKAAAAKWSTLEDYRTGKITRWFPITQRYLGRKQNQIMNKFNLTEEDLKYTEFDYVADKADAEIECKLQLGEAATLDVLLAPTNAEVGLEDSLVQIESEYAKLKPQKEQYVIDKLKRFKKLLDDKRVRRTFAIKRVAYLNLPSPDHLAIRNATAGYLSLANRLGILQKVAVPSVP